ncbi:uncharacterized protein LOC106474667 [Limulus polyphemus]|uniref:Autophagy-related protein 27 n=1 Tax=Limulus polyphemus TaxID=6850 RepID=A0ABM1BXZ6_LIMPO|nr:uncharacterized protein LOC106474667 [Limulus polyphemus]
MARSVGEGFNLLVFIVFLHLVFPLLCNSETCTKINSCVCKFSNGSVINLTPLASKDTARWRDKATSTNDTYRYFYNPCFDFKEGPADSPLEDCSTEVAACQVSPDHKLYYNLGNQASAQFHWNNTGNVLQLVYQAPHTRKQTNVTLVCSSESSSPKLDVLGEINSGSEHYVFNLITKCACPDGCPLTSPHTDRGLSTGSVLILIFFIFLTIYVIG